MNARFIRKPIAALLVACLLCDPALAFCQEPCWSAFPDFSTEAMAGRALHHLATLVGSAKPKAEAIEVESQPNAPGDQTPALPSGPLAALQSTIEAAIHAWNDPNKLYSLVPAGGITWILRWEVGGALSQSLEEFRGLVGARRWILRTGMGFRSIWTWWNAKTRMAAHNEPFHTGNDFAIYEDSDGSIQGMNEREVVAFLDGTVRWVFEDLMQLNRSRKELFVEGPNADRAVGPVLIVAKDKKVAAAMKQSVQLEMPGIREVTTLVTDDVSIDEQAAKYSVVIVGRPAEWEFHSDVLDVSGTPNDVLRALRHFESVRQGSTPVPAVTRQWMDAVNRLTFPEWHWVITIQEAVRQGKISIGEDEGWFEMNGDPGTIGRIRRQSERSYLNFQTERAGGFRFYPRPFVRFALLDVLPLQESRQVAAQSLQELQQTMRTRPIRFSSDQLDRFLTVENRGTIETLLGQYKAGALSRESARATLGKRISTGVPANRLMEAWATIDVVLWFLNPFSNGTNGQDPQTGKRWGEFLTLLKHVGWRALVRFGHIIERLLRYAILPKQKPQLTAA